MFDSQLLAPARRQRPDLRRDCDAVWIAPEGYFHRHRDDKDLIYEGIATFTVENINPGLNDDKDLIYEGSAACLSKKQHTLYD